EKPLPQGRRKYCDGKCGYEFFVKHNFGLLRFKIFERDDYTCQNKDCGYKWEAFDETKENWGEHQDKHGFTVGDRLNCDHITPICLGGAEFDEANLQTLCVECHKKKTKGEVSFIAAIEREVRLCVEEITWEEIALEEAIRFEEKRKRYGDFWKSLGVGV
ncbi:unnamed protein product, partial [marine sediment metagenome]